MRIKVEEEGEHQESEVTASLAKGERAVDGVWAIGQLNTLGGEEQGEGGEGVVKAVDFLVCGVRELWIGSLGKRRRRRTRCTNTFVGRATRLRYEYSTVLYTNR